MLRMASTCAYALLLLRHPALHQSALLAGSTLQLLTLSSTLSEGVAPTGGQYGFVPTGAFLRLIFHPQRPRLTCPAFGRFTRLRALPLLWR
jgi:hypothetical protein